MGKRGKWLLLAGMLLIALVLGAGCKDTGEQGGDSSTEATYIKDLQKYNFRIVAWWNGEPDMSTDVGRAAHERWKKAEQDYNCTVTFINMPYEDIKEKIAQTALSGEPFADFAWMQAIDAIPSLVKQGYILETDQYFDFNSGKWPKLGLRASEYNGKHYGFAADVKSTHGIWYNKTLFSKLSLPDLYELQQSGAWTWDKYLEIAKQATSEKKSDGKRDTYGLAEGYPIVDRLIHSNGTSIVKVDGGSYAFNVDDPKVTEAIKFALKVYEADPIHPTRETGADGAFLGGNVAMYGGESYMGENFYLNSSDDFGFVFYPKGPQATEYSCVTTNTNIMVIPSSAKNVENACLVFNAMTDFDAIDEDVDTYFGKSMFSKEDVATAKNMLDICELERLSAFPDLHTLFWENIVSQVRSKDITLEKAILDYKQQGQSIIDTAMK